LKLECIKCGTKFEKKSFGIIKCPNCESKRAWRLDGIFKQCLLIIIFTPLILFVVAVISFLIHPVMGSNVILMLIFGLPIIYPAMIFMIVVPWKKDNSKMPKILSYVTGLLIIINFIIMFIITFILFSGMSIISVILIICLVIFSIPCLILIYLFHAK